MVGEAAAGGIESLLERARTGFRGDFGGVGNYFWEGFENGGSARH